MTVTGDAGALQVHVSSFSGHCHDGMVIWHEGPTTVPIDNSFTGKTVWVVLHAYWQPTPTPTFDFEIISETDWNALAPDQQAERIRLCSIAIPAGATFIDNSWIVYNGDELDRLGRFFIRGIVHHQSDLPSPNRVQIGDAYFILDSGMLVYWNGSNWTPFQNAWYEELQRHRQNLYTDEKHLTDEEDCALEQAPTLSEGIPLSCTNPVVPAKKPLVLPKSGNFSIIDDSGEKYIILEESGNPIPDVYIGTEGTTGADAVQWFHLAQPDSWISLLDDNGNPVEISEVMVQTGGGYTSVNPSVDGPYITGAVLHLANPADISATEARVIYGQKSILADLDDELLLTQQILYPKVRAADVSVDDSGFHFFNSTDQQSFDQELDDFINPPVRWPTYTGDDFEWFSLESDTDSGLFVGDYSDLEKAGYQFLGIGSWNDTGKYIQILIPDSGPFNMPLDGEYMVRVFQYTSGGWPPFPTAVGKTYRGRTVYAEYDAGNSRWEVHIGLLDNSGSPLSFPDGSTIFAKILKGALVTKDRIVMSAPVTLGSGSEDQPVNADEPLPYNSPIALQAWDTLKQSSTELKVVSSLEFYRNGLVKARDFAYIDSDSWASPTKKMTVSHLNAVWDSNSSGVSISGQRVQIQDSSGNSNAVYFALPFLTDGDVIRRITVYFNEVTSADNFDVFLVDYDMVAGSDNSSSLGNLSGQSSPHTFGAYKVADTGHSIGIKISITSSLAYNVYVHGIVVEFEPRNIRGISI